ncbi:uncharacterized protein JN550_012304 [Neoarthrinium moseri]|uniref:uncharacterized protein n=1 Tax=Neoarthrinium moseri TaxID=1658444 RepID=UPI001FDDD0F7|nr:uncharacterized protein JN550_012304 [Neoarthrinium moseri]KAI1858946.1 hypothetical protein JN550_012304 [Neoarthrinium moseri]
MFCRAIVLLLAACLATISGARPTEGVVYCQPDERADTVHTSGDPTSGPGVWITHNDAAEGNYFLYENLRDAKPWKHITIPQGARRFVQLCPTWQGRLVRGTAKVNLDGKDHKLGTWVESSMSNGALHGDVSFLRGCDGGAKIITTDGSKLSRGCEGDLLNGAPPAALVAKDSGVKVLADLEGSGEANNAARQWLKSKCSESQVYLGHGVDPVINSVNGQLEVVFSAGRF